jgi:creatinine amidohydrolase
MKSGLALQGRALLQARCAQLPTVLQQVLEESKSHGTEGPLLRPDLAWAASQPQVTQVVVTGIGASEGPARLLVAQLRTEAKQDAQFVPLSQFAGPFLLPVQAVLVVFSQGLSPNARLALRQAPRGAATILYTSVVPDAHAAPGCTAGYLARLQADGVLVAVLPPRCEDRLFLRVLGPAAAMLAGVQLAQVLARRLGSAMDAELQKLPERVGAAMVGVDEAVAAAGQQLARCGVLPTAMERTWTLAALWQQLPRLQLAFLTTEGLGELCLGLRWKLMEGTGQCDPPVWDVLQFVHGPLQLLYRRPALLCVLTGPQQAGQEELLQRLAALLPAHHALVRLPAQLPTPLRLFEHDAQGNQLVLSALPQLESAQAVQGAAEALWDLEDWPGKGQDAALYGVHEPPAAADVQPPQK